MLERTREESRDKRNFRLESVFTRISRIVASIQKKRITYLVSSFLFANIFLQSFMYAVDMYF